MLTTAILLGLVPAIASAQTSAGPPARGESAPGVTVFLVGDAGVINDERTQLLDHLGQSADSIHRVAPERHTATVFLGDNIYDAGIRPDYRDADIRILREQVTLNGRGGSMPVYFIAGNHDWGDDEDDEEEGIRRLGEQRLAIDSLAADASRVARLLPAVGCPGPYVLDFGPELRLIFVDTEWMIRRASSCGEGVRGALVADVTSALSEVLDRPALLLAHHPVATGGPHGGGGSILDQVWKRLRRTRQDLGSSRYDDMADDLIGAIGSSRHDRVLIASGHEHSLQVIEVEEDDTEFVQIVSGSGAKLTSVDRIDGTRFRAKRRGYVRLDVDGPSVTVTAFGLEDGAMRQLWVGSLFPATPPPAASGS